MVEVGVVEYARCIIFNQVIGDVKKLHKGTCLVWFGANGQVEVHFDIYLTIFLTLVLSSWMKIIIIRNKHMII